jgi:hypothetical protein
MIVEEHKNKYTDTEQSTGAGCELNGKVYRHSENLKNDISFLMAAEAMTIEDLMELFFDSASRG